MDDKLFLFLIALFVVVLVLSFSHTKEGYSYSTFSSKPYYTGIGLSGSGPMMKTDSDSGANLILTKKWYSFESALSPDIAGYFYSIFPGLQTKESMRYYGLTAEMMRVLNVIGPKLVNPEMYKTTKDVDNMFMKDALMLYNDELGVKPMSGLYRNKQEYGEYTDVL